MHNKNKFSVISSLIWKFLERTGTQGVQFIVQIILARILAPQQFGTIAIVLVFINVANVFVQSGLNTALVQKKEVDEADFSTIFYISIIIALILYLLIFFSAPSIAKFYRDTSLVSILRVLSIVLFTGALNSVQIAFLSRSLLFKRFFVSSLVAILFSGGLGVFAAYLNFGVWALVIQQISNQIILSIVLWFTVKWRPKLIFSLKKAKVLFSFGWKILVSSLSNVLYLEVRTLIIGRIFDSSTLAYYKRGENFPRYIVNNLNGSIQTVMLPTLSAYQEDLKKSKSIMRKAIATSSFLVFPVMIGLIVIAKPLVLILLTDKWLFAVPYIQIFSISYALLPLYTANIQAINAMGRSDIYLKLEIIRKAIGISILVISIPMGIYAIAIGQAIYTILSSLISLFSNKALLKYDYKEQFLDIIPSLTLSLIMGVSIYFIQFIDLKIWQTLLSQVFSGALIYIGLAAILKIKILKYLYETVKEVINRLKSS